MILARSLLFVLAFYLWSLVYGICVIPLLVCPRRWAQTAFRYWSLGVFFLLRVCCDIRVELRGKQYAPTGRALVAAKHQCMFDVFAQFVWLPDSCFTMKKELTWIPVLGWFGPKMGTLVLDRDGQAATLRKMLREARERMEDERQLVIFPEGHRGVPGHAGDYRPGVAGLYRDLGLPVHPVATNSGVHWPAHGFIRRPGTIVFEFLEPIPAGLPRAQFMRVLEERIETASNALLSL
jgi:1-acyl-sn-glycerol-3-phosphate acyltransferase